MRGLVDLLRRAVRVCPTRSSESGYYPRVATEA